MAKKAKSGKKGRKHSRCKDSIWYKAYTIERRQEKNKVKKINRHLKKHPDDKQCINQSVIVDYKIPHLKPEQYAEQRRILIWKCYLKGVI